MIRILYSAKPEEFEIYRDGLKSALDIPHIVTHDPVAPETVDYILYAPDSALQDFSAFTRLKLVQSLWAGVETVTPNATLTQPLARMVEFGLNQGMADYVMGHVLRHHLGTDFFAAQTGDWRGDNVPPLANQRTVGILGLGALGHDCATRLAKFGFEVCGWSRSEKHSDTFTCFHGEDGLNTALERSEILVLLLPNTPETHHIINADTLSKMRDGAMIINPGRGSLIDDDALLSALNTGKVSGATLDVFTTEPLPKDHPYGAHPNVLVTPHVASATRPETAIETVVENIRRGEAGEPFLHLVDRDAGY